MEILTRQEMFNRAVIGLRSQKWERCYNSGIGCVYEHEGKHCAWGWVDLSLTSLNGGSVSSLKQKGIGLAAGLSYDDEMFACYIQDAHDSAMTARAMEFRFRELAKKFQLTWPEEVPGVP